MKTVENTPLPTRYPECVPRHLRALADGIELLTWAIARQPSEIITMAVGGDSSVLLHSSDETARCPSGYLTPLELHRLQQLGWTCTRAEDAGVRFHKGEWGIYWYLESDALS